MKSVALVNCPSDDVNNQGTRPVWKRKYPGKAQKLRISHGEASNRTAVGVSRTVLDSGPMPPATTSLAHWGAFTAGVESGEIASVIAFDGDTGPPALYPSALLGNLPGSIRHRSRVATPAVRRGWLRDGPGATSARRADEFVRMSWDELTELLADEFRRVVDTHGNEAIYGGSYRWASAGRFHHAQSYAHRFLKFLGGYTFSRHSYSLAVNAHEPPVISQGA